MGFKIGSGFSYDYYRLPDTILPKPEYIATLSPFVTKRTGQWDFRAGFQAVIDKNMNSSADFHFYPDLRLGFSVVPSYVNFYAGLSGKLERNDPLKIIGENPYLLPSILFTLPNTDHALIFSAGVNGNDAIGGDYLFSASYSLINNLLLYSNIITPKSLIITPGGPLKPYMGNHFLATAGDAELLKIHGEMSGTVTEKISFKWDANIYKYSLSESGHPWNKPAWDAGVELKYNLRNKILAGAGLTAIGKRWQQEREADPLGIKSQLEAPAHVNLNFNAEYRYSKVLSFWAKINNISPNRYYEWAYYPTQGLLLMAGFTYSL